MSLWPIVERDGLWWPERVGANAHKYLRSVEHLESILRYGSGWRSVVQAGGYIGIWPRRLAEAFATVYTYEPEPVLFTCLVRNCEYTSDVYAARAVLFDRRERRNLISNSRNTGKNRTLGAGEIPVVRIDDLMLDDCDAILLDVEGAELPALRGGVDTIRRCRPSVISAESWGHERFFGYTPQDLMLFMKDEGYRHVETVDHDLVFVPA